MPTINSFEEIEAWTRARRLANELHRIFLKDSAKNDFGLKNQVSRSIGSVMDNIAEGFERGGNKEFIQFLFIAKGSAGETRSQLFRMLDRNYISKEEFESLLAELSFTSKLIMNFIKYLKNTDLKGSKYHEPESSYGGQL